MPLHGNINSWIFQNNSPAIFAGESYPAVLDDGNTVAWYDYTDLDTITEVGGYISKWADKLGSEHDLNNAGGDAAKPILLESGIMVDGVQRGMKTSPFTLKQPTIIYLVFRQITWTNGDRFYDGNVINSGMMFQTGTTPNIAINSGATGGQSTDLTLNQFSVVKALYNGSSSFLQVDANTKATGDAGSNDMGGFTLGRTASGSAYSHAEFKEIIIRKIADTETSEAAIYDYLKKKHNLNFSDTWILAGQSNMMANDTVANQTIVGYNSALLHGYIWNKDSSAFELINPGTNTTYNRPSGVYSTYFGPETSFAKDLSSYTGVDQHIVKFAWGATRIYPDPVNDDWNVNSHELLDELKGLITSANAALTTNKMRIKGILWVQGETDAPYSSYYYDNLSALFANLRAFCEGINSSNGSTTSLINVVSRLSSNQDITPSDLAVMRTAQADFISNNGDILVDTDSYGLKVDNIHFTSDGIISMGQDAALAVSLIYND